MERQRICERCADQIKAADFDFCNQCGMYLCVECMTDGCCERVPAESGNAAQEDPAAHPIHLLIDDEPVPPKKTAEA